jgi:GH35 family endo-1,4-beta-xylanase
MRRESITLLLASLIVMLNVTPALSLPESLRVRVDNRLRYETEEDDFTNISVTAGQVWSLSLQNQGTQKLDAPVIEIISRLGADAFPYRKPDESGSIDGVFKHRWNLNEIPPGSEQSLWLSTTFTRKLDFGFDSQRRIVSTFEGKSLDCTIYVKVTPRERFRALQVSVAAAENAHVKSVEVDLKQCSPKPSWFTQAADFGWYVTEPSANSLYTFSTRIQGVLNVNSSKVIYKPQVTISAFSRQSEGTSSGSTDTVSDDTLGNVTFSAKGTYNWFATWRERRDLTHLPVSTGTDTLTDLISQNTERYRKGDIRLRITDENRKPLANADVQIRQTQHDFLFGCAYPGEKDLKGTVGRFQDLFSSVFNYLSTEGIFKWRVLEPKQGSIDWGEIDRLLSWAQSKNIKVKGHCLVWGNWPDGSGTGVPSWILDKTREEVRQLMEMRIKQLVGKYAGKVTVWDVVNEPLHVKWFEEHFGSDYIELALKWAREADPKSILTVNEYHILDDYRNKKEFLSLIGRLKSASIPVDVAGLQEHEHSLWLSPQDIYDGLNEISKTGCDIHITEFDVDVVNQPIRGGFKKGVWDEQAQAEYHEMFYRTLFSHPRVKAISTWSFVDPRWLGTNCGLVKPDLTSKPVYETLNRLINKEWRTQMNSKTDSDGMIRFRGFYGTYEMSVLVNGEKRVLSFRLDEHGSRELELVAGKSVVAFLNLSGLGEYLFPIGIASILAVLVILFILRRARLRKSAPTR